MSPIVIEPVFLNAAPALNGSTVTLGVPLLPLSEDEHLAIFSKVVAQFAAEHDAKLTGPIGLQFTNNNVAELTFTVTGRAPRL